MPGAGKHVTARRCPESALRSASNGYSRPSLGSLLALCRVDTKLTETPSPARDPGLELRQGCGRNAPHPNSCMQGGLHWVSQGPVRCRLPFPNSGHAHGPTLGPKCRIWTGRLMSLDASLCQSCLAWSSPSVETSPLSCKEADGDPFHRMWQCYCHANPTGIALLLQQQRCQEMGPDINNKTLRQGLLYIWNQVGPAALHVTKP